MFRSSARHQGLYLFVGEVAKLPTALGNGVLPFLIVVCKDGRIKGTDGSHNLRTFPVQKRSELLTEQQLALLVEHMLSHCSHLACLLYRAGK